MTGVRDLGVGVDTTAQGGVPVLPWTRGDMMMTLYLVRQERAPPCLTPCFTYCCRHTRHGGVAIALAAATIERLQSVTQAGGGVLTLRASATEPKLKYYLEVVGTDADAAAATADALEAAVDAQLVRPDEAGLRRRGS